VRLNYPSFLVVGLDNICYWGYGSHVIAANETGGKIWKREISGG
jgi:hypothetical protein